MVDAHIDRGGVYTLQVSVEHVLEIVEVVVLSASGIVVSTGDGETLIPSIVGSHSTGDISTALVIDHVLEVASANADVGGSVVAVASVGGAFLAGDLHHANLASSTSDSGVAAGFLKSNGSEENGRNARRGLHILEH